jgi:hypothetical protein
MVRLLAALALFVAILVGLSPAVYLMVFSLGETLPPWAPGWFCWWFFFMMGCDRHLRWALSR